LVAERNRNVIGFASLSKYSTKCAYSDTAEISLYVKEEHQNQGIGKKLMESIIKEGKNVGLHVVIARITEGNEKSVYLHKSVGFKHIGILKEVGYKFDKLLDVHLMQKIY
jgi:phosphinothricin acetyltransferase